MCFLLALLPHAGAHPHQVRAFKSHARRGNATTGKREAVLRPVERRSAEPIPLRRSTDRAFRAQRWGYGRSP